jgi:preprotein translocase subunit SecA
MFYQILINELVYTIKTARSIKSLRICGLYIVGTERNDSRRVDNQLQVDVVDRVIPVLQDFLSLDDNLLRLLVDQKFKISCRLKFQMTHH